MDSDSRFSVPQMAPRMVGGKMGGLKQLNKESVKES